MMMRSKYLKAGGPVAAGVLFLWTGLCARAGTSAVEGYGDHFLYDVGRLPKNILVEAIGHVVLHAESHEDSSIPPEKRAPRPSSVVTRFPIYEPRGGGFASVGEIRVAETVPASRGGYGGWIKYLATERRGRFIRVIVDPYKDRRVWVQPAPGDAVIFSELIGRAKPVEGEIDIFLFSRETRLYSGPRLDAPFQLLRSNENERAKAYAPVAFTRGFVQIVSRRIDTRDPHGISTVDSEPLGWIRIRDDAGRLAFFLYTYSWL
jgi:hypothetical protein